MFVTPAFGTPGQSGTQFTVDTTIVDASSQHTLKFAHGTIASDAVDAGSSPTTLLRSGLVLALRASDKKLVPYVATGLVNSVYVPGVDVAKYILPHPVSTTGLLGVPGELSLFVIAGGDLKPGSIPNLDFQARNQLGPRFWWGDDFPAGEDPLTVTADRSVAVEDHGTVFRNDGASGAVTLTLGAGCRVPGWSCEMHCLADQNLTINAGAGLLIGDGGLAFASAAFSTASHRIGGRLRVEYSGKLSKFVATNLSAGPGNVVTYA